MLFCLNHSTKIPFRVHILEMTMTEPLPSGIPPGAGGHQDLLKQLKVFLAGASTASGARGANPRLAQTALHLLVHLPAARFPYISLNPL